MAEEEEQEIPIEPEDPEYEVEEHIRFRRRQQVLNTNLSKLVESHLSEFKQTMDGTTYAFTKLSLKNQGISEVTELIQQYVHLRNVDLSLNQLKEIPSLLNLKFITHLNLARNQITSISFLSRESTFPYLKEINLLGNKLDILPTILTKNLRKINLNYNQISNLQEFDGHPLIEVIQLRGNKLKSLKGLKNLASLQELFIAENDLDSLKGITNCPKLTKIHARKNKIASLSDYPEVDSVIYLNLRENAVAKVDDLNGANSSLKTLNLLATPLEAQMADNTKKQVWMKFRHYNKINKAELTEEEKEEFDKQFKEREKERLQKQAAERQAAEAAERQAKENPDA